MTTQDIKVFIATIDGKFHVMLRHEDGREEISDQGWASYEECAKAIEKYAEDRDLDIQRVQ